MALTDGKTYSLEQVETALEEKGSYGPAPGLDSSNQPLYNDKYTAGVLRKVDWRLVPVLTVLYTISFLDKGSIGNAKVAGMTRDLHMTGTQYNIALTMFFLPYAIFEVPSNIVLKLIRPSLWLTVLVIAWGTVMTCQGIVQNYHGLLVTRILLGFFESGFFPASTYLLGDWYCRFELQWRLSVFFSASSMAGAFSGLLAFALEKMDGIGKLEGWRWIFILEGILTVLIGCMIPWILPDSPERASFLTIQEKEFIRNRLEQDSGTSSGRVQTSDAFKWEYVRAALLDWKIWFTVFIYWGNTIPIYGFTYMAPTIILELGYTSAQAQLLTIPIYVVGLAGTLIASWLADRHQTRWPFIVIPYSIALMGMIGLLAIPHPALPGLTYAFLFAIPVGVYPSVVSLISWISNNLSPTWKRSVGMAVSIMMGNFGGAIGCNIYLAKQAPKYQTGFGISLACLALAIVCTFVLRWVYMRANAERDKISEEEVRAKYTDEELLDLGDRSPLYRYVL